MSGYGKSAYLNRLTARLRLKSAEVGETRAERSSARRSEQQFACELEGSSPPAVFIGKFGYPKVFVGPMLVQQAGNTYSLDSPEEWIPNKLETQQIAEFRLQLVRGKEIVGIKDFKNKLVQKIQEVALAKKSVYSHAEFTKKPRGVEFSLDDSHEPFGPSAQIKSFEKENAKFEMHLEKAHYDIDLRAASAVLELYEKDLQFTQIQKAFSVGAFGLEKNRRLVPTRWSITAVDDILGKYLVRKVKENPLLDCFQVFEFSALENYFAIVLVPNIWQYEWTEAFIRVLGNEEVIFSDWEGNFGKKEYSSVGGCFYSVRLAIAEQLAKIGKQATALVFREAYPGYIPLGVWACREITRNAMKQEPKEFADLKSALAYVNSKLRLGVGRFRQESTLLRNLEMQTSLVRFF